MITIRPGSTLQVSTRRGTSEPVVVEPVIAQLRIPGRNLDEDHDADGLTSLDELRRRTDPLVTDTDADGRDDGAEVRAGGNPLDPAG
jgi:hypothetical protein